MKLHEHPAWFRPDILEASRVRLYRDPQAAAFLLRLRLHGVSIDEMGPDCFGSGTRADEHQAALVFGWNLMRRVLNEPNDATARGGGW